MCLYCWSRPIPDFASARRQLLRLPFRFFLSLSSSQPTPILPLSRVESHHGHGNSPNHRRMSSNPPRLFDHCLTSYQMLRRGLVLDLSTAFGELRPSVDRIAHP